MPNSSREDPSTAASGQNASANPTFGDVIAQRLNRRDLVKGLLATATVAAAIPTLTFAATGGASAQGGSRFAFTELEAGIDHTHHVAPGYDADVLIRWGDPLFADAPEFDPMTQTAEKQARQFGYNNDYVGFIPLEGSSDRGLLVVNHEYTNEELMFPGVGEPQERRAAAFSKMTADLVGIEMAAHGGSVLEVRREGGKWRVVRDSRFNRRITADTPMEITGPAAADARLRTAADAAGTRALGTLNNCAGGVTPWGTWLTCEENVHYYFSGRVADDHPEAGNHKRMGVPASLYAWGRFHERFDLGKHPNEPNRFGWVVEIDPSDPRSVPKKRTAMGRFKHEGAAGIVNRDGRYVVYQGDDERFDYVYKFITGGRVDRQNRAANMDLLDDGTLHVARFNADGTGRWLPLTHGEGPLTVANGFASQADVLIETRRAGDLLGATKMDRPEDVEANPTTDKVYLALTNNTSRKPEQVDAANPRPNNRFGHVIEMTPRDRDHGSDEFTWEILLKCGDPAAAGVGAQFSSATTSNGWFGMPDNCAVDGQGRLWISTDGNSAATTGRADGIWAIETEGELRGTAKHFFRVPTNAEMCGPVFTPDDTTLFLAVQHPAESEDEKVPSNFERPLTRWPDFKEGIPPRPSLVAVTRQGGGRIG